MFLFLFPFHTEGDNEHEQDGGYRSRYDVTQSYFSPFRNNFRLILVHFEIISGAGNSASGVMEGVSAISKVIEKLPGPLKEVILVMMKMMMSTVDYNDGDYDADHDDTKRGSLGDAVVQGQQDSHRQLCVQAALPGILEGEDFLHLLMLKAICWK